MFKPIGNCVGAEALGDVKLSCSVGLAQYSVSLPLQIRVQPLEQVLKEQSEKLSCQFEPLVAIVVLVIHLLWVYQSFKKPSGHGGKIKSLLPEVVSWCRHVRQDHTSKNIPCLIHLRPQREGVLIPIFTSVLASRSICIVVAGFLIAFLLLSPSIALAVSVGVPARFEFAGTVLQGLLLDVDANLHALPN